MTVSRKSTDENPTMIRQDATYELTQECYDDNKMELQKRSGYDVPPPEVLEQKAVDEKLPMGSQSY